MSTNSSNNSYNNSERAGRPTTRASQRSAEQDAQENVVNDAEALPLVDEVIEEADPAEEEIQIPEPSPVLETTLEPPRSRPTEADEGEEENEPLPKRHAPGRGPVPTPPAPRVPPAAIAISPTPSRASSRAQVVYVPAPAAPMVPAGGQQQQRLRFLTPKYRAGTCPSTWLADMRSEMVGLRYDEDEYPRIFIRHTEDYDRLSRMFRDVATWSEFEELFTALHADTRAVHLSFAKLMAVEPSDHSTYHEFIARFVHEYSSLHDKLAVSDYQALSMLQAKLVSPLRELVDPAKRAQVVFTALLRHVAAGAATPASSTAVLAAQVSRPSGYHDNRREQDRPSSSSQDDCFKCGKPGHVSRNCPDQVCAFCKEPGHIIRNCPHPECKKSQLPDHQRNTPSGSRNAQQGQRQGKD
ncbi:hypothetical protein GGF42_000117 [Coemansia sp. RSA 2424]|nr:hypothetical protein GGF42_000117 [Coemansia sp. RSA 2424]